MPPPDPVPARKSRFVGPFHVMLVLMVAAYAILPLVPADPDQGSSPGTVLTTVLLCSALLIGIGASGCSRIHLVLALWLSAAIALGVVVDAAGIATFRSVQLLFSLLTLIGIKTILALVLRAQRVDADKILAAICVLFLLGAFWAQVYTFIDGPLMGGGAFTSPTGQAGGRSLELLYFSFVTLTTLGYGDVVPITPFARVLVTLEALTGQLYLAILVARLVALHVVDSGEDPRA